MITGALKNNVDCIWDTFWSGGISNPVSVIEQFTYLLFIKDLDERQVQIDKRRKLGDPTATEDIFDASQQDLRWRNLIEDRDIARRKATIINKVFPFIKAMGGKGFQEHMANASFDIESEATLSRVMELIDQLRFQNKDMKGDLYEYMLDKLSTSGTNGQFRTPSHIIELLVALMEPKRTIDSVDEDIKNLAAVVGLPDDGETLASSTRHSAATPTPPFVMRKRYVRSPST